MKPKYEVLDSLLLGSAGTVAVAFAAGLEVQAGTFTSHGWWPMACMVSLAVVLAYFAVRARRGIAVAAAERTCLMRALQNLSMECSSRNVMVGILDGALENPSVYFTLLRDLPEGMAARLQELALERVESERQHFIGQIPMFMHDGSIACKQRVYESSLSKYGSVLTTLSAARRAAREDAEAGATAS